MSVAAVLMPVADVVVRATDKTPNDADVKAGGWGALIFVLLIIVLQESSGLPATLGSGGQPGQVTGP